MSETELPRVTVTLPDGHRVTARVHRWRQDRDGRWWAEVTLYVPASEVDRVEGEDYRRVGREAARAAEPRYVLQSLPPAAGSRRPRMELHEAGCWALREHLGGRITPVEDATMARASLRFADTTACPACRPAPPATSGE